MILWLNPVSGLSGDMLLGALIDLGAPVEDIRAAVATTGLRDWDLTVERTAVNAVPCLSARVTAGTGTARSAAELIAMTQGVTPRPVAELAVRAMRAIAEAESRIHDQDLDELHLHELGGDDTIVDIVGVAAALHSLMIDEVLSAPLRLGSGVVDSRHGPLPVPAPATLALLEGMTVELSTINGETVTPTGAALLRAAGCRFGELPPFVVRRTGYGAGTRRFSAVPNVLAATLGVPVAADASAERSMVLVETTVDDVPGEYLAYAVQAVLDAGAADAWLSPVIGKKGRPAQVVGVLCQPGQADAIEARLLAETGSLGARRTQVQKTSLHRHFDTIDLDGQPVRIKSGPSGRKPEFEDIRGIAAQSGMPLRAVADMALAQHTRELDAKDRREASAQNNPHIV